MKYHIKTEDDYFIGYNGEFVTKSKKERAVYDNKSLALWYVKNTNLFGKLTIYPTDK